MTPRELRDRVDAFADAVIGLCRHSVTDPLQTRLLVQLQDSATSTAANYHAACRAGSRRMFVAKLSIALEEADESAYWLQRMSNNGIGSPAVVARLLQEAVELAAILGASRRTAAGRPVRRR